VPPHNIQQQEMHMLAERSFTHSTLTQALLTVLLTAVSLGAQAAEPYYNPANPASGIGKTIGYELFRTIGCPGRALFDAPCAVAPAPAPVVVPADGDGDGVVDSADKCPTTPPGRKVNALGCELDGDADGVLDGVDRCPTTPAGRKVDASGCEPDSDGDGVVDPQDNCPGTLAGRAVNAIGCEVDSDGDGVVDALDNCPTTPAGRKVNAQGCELDGDGDGVVDALDNCPTTPAGHKVNAQGCDLDSDGDGIIDLDDRCPDTPAGDRVDGKGCSLPKVMVLKGVTFENDRDLLRNESVAILDEAVATLKRYPGLNVEVAGHTDSVGRDSHNMELSQRRAKTVMDYFVSHGVATERLTAKGYGETQPVADNAKADGRAQNRRVELRALN